MIRIHFPAGRIVSPTLISPERYVWLHAAHSRGSHLGDFTHELTKLLSRYHPRTKSLNPQGLQLKLANHWAIPLSLRIALETTFLTIAEPFGNPLNCSMTPCITYCSAFEQDKKFGAITNSFLYRWTNSCIANPEYEPEDMHKNVLHALASSECMDAPYLVVLILPTWDDMPWSSRAIRRHVNMTILISILAGHTRFVPAHKQADEATVVLTPAIWPVEFVLIANPKGRAAFMDQNRIRAILTPTIQATCHMALEATHLFPPHSFPPSSASARNIAIPMRPLHANPATPAKDAPR